MEQQLYLAGLLGRLPPVALGLGSIEHCYASMNRMLFPCWFACALAQSQLTAVLEEPGGLLNKTGVRLF